MIPFELLPESPEKFIGKIVDFMGVPYPNDLNINKNVNKSLCTGAIYLRRIINRFINSETNPFFVLVENPFRLSRNKLLKKLSKYIDFNYPLKYLFGFFCSKKIYQKSVRDEILSIYSDSNDRLQQLIGFDLERYGYIQADKKQV